MKLVLESVNLKRCHTYGGPLGDNNLLIWYSGSEVAMAFRVYCDRKTTLTFWWHASTSFTRRIKSILFRHEIPYRRRYSLSRHRQSIHCLPGFPVFDWYRWKPRPAYFLAALTAKHSSAGDRDKLSPKGSNSAFDHVGSSYQDLTLAVLWPSYMGETSLLLRIIKEAVRIDTKILTVFRDLKMNGWKELSPRINRNQGNNHNLTNHDYHLVSFFLLTQ